MKRLLYLCWLLCLSAGGEVVVTFNELNFTEKLSNDNTMIIVAVYAELRINISGE